MFILSLYPSLSRRESEESPRGQFSSLGDLRWYTNLSRRYKDEEVAIIRLLINYLINEQSKGTVHAFSLLIFDKRETSKEFLPVIMV